jgi:RNA polymerase-binding transcription factor DksA
MKKPTSQKHTPAPKPAGSQGAHPATTADILGRPVATAAPAGRVPAKWRWHYGVLQALADRLRQEHGGLRKTATEPLAPHSPGAGDSATDEFDHVLALSLLSAEQNALQEVEEALGRIRDGTYGVCQETGARIPAARLKAVPWTRFTRAVEERLEQPPRVR